MKFLLDTNVISEIRKGDRSDPNVARWVARTRATEMGTSVLVLAEIRHGIELLRRRDPEQAKSYDRWFSQMRAELADRVLPVDEPIADAWALFGIPNPLPVIDALLAATAIVHDLTLVTRNVAQIAVTGVSVLDPFRAHPATRPEPWL